MMYKNIISLIELLDLLESILNYFNGVCFIRNITMSTTYFLSLSNTYKFFSPHFMLLHWVFAFRNRIISIGTFFSPFLSLKMTQNSLAFLLFPRVFPSKKLIFAWIHFLIIILHLSPPYQVQSSNEHRTVLSGKDLRCYRWRLGHFQQRNQRRLPTGRCPHPEVLRRVPGRPLHYLEVQRKIRIPFGSNFTFFVGRCQWGEARNCRIGLPHSGHRKHHRAPNLQNQQEDR